MYTQCPDCEIAFRITADVLKQAAGKVRCGGCGNAFNALDFLTEQTPAQVAGKNAGKEPPKLTPEIYDTEDGLPPAISAAQSAALLKTLEELAGSDVRIEDTGVEWRVVDDEGSDDATAGDDVAEIFDNPGESAVDELLVESATPVDEILTATVVKSSVDELRFDDNTPLPDDFGEKDQSVAVAADDAESVAEEDDIEAENDDEEAQEEIALSNPEEWQDILGEFDEAADDTAASPEDAEGEDADDPLDVDSQFLLQAEAMGIDISGAYEMEDEEEDGDTVSQPDEDEDGDTVSQPDPDQDDDHDVVPLSEEEHSLNKQIDEDLLSLAIEDEDGIASAITIASEDAEEKVIKEQQLESEDVELAFAELKESQRFETIVMEGDVVRSADSEMKRAADAVAAANLAGKGGPRTERFVHKPSILASMSSASVGGLVALVLLLIIQVMHQSREALATIPAFNGAIGPIYRAFGQPLQPAWDITGWRFEATKGSTSNGDAELTIYSRIGNKSDKPLPFPLIGISLTDRFEETIGSRVLDPAAYLPPDLDPRELVRPGNTFNAVITIQSPSDDATGFKLNVCYRLSGGQLRCAIDDFK